MARPCLRQVDGRKGRSCRTEDGPQEPVSEATSCRCRHFRGPWIGSSLGAKPGHPPGSGCRRPTCELPAFPVTGLFPGPTAPTPASERRGCSGAARAGSRPPPRRTACSRGQKLAARSLATQTPPTRSHVCLPVGTAAGLETDTGSQAACPGARGLSGDWHIWGRGARVQGRHRDAGVPAESRSRAGL